MTVNAAEDRARFRGLPAKAASIEETPTSLPNIHLAEERAVVPWVINADRVNDFFLQIVTVISRSKAFFRRYGQMIHVGSSGNIQTVTSKNLNGFLSSLVEIGMYEERQDARLFRGYRLLPPLYAQAFINSPIVVGELPEVTHFTTSPLFDREWNLTATRGYQVKSGIYYDGPTIEPRDSTAFLDRLTQDFCWQSDIDRVNFLGQLVTGITIVHWPGKHPMAIFNANVPGAGKTTLGRSMALLLHGVCHSVSYTSNDEEFEKQLATLVEAGDRVILIDNAKHGSKMREVSSAVLERSLTEPVLNFRRLGSSTSIRRVNDVLFGLTMNDARIGADLLRRSLPINLEMKGPARSRQFRHDSLDDFILSNRVELLSELVGLVQRWLEAERPMPTNPARHSIGQGWAATVGAILTHAGLPGFLGNMEQAERAFDPDFQALLEVCEAAPAAPPMTPGEWATKCVEDGLLRDRLYDELGFAKSDRANATVMGTLLSRFVDAVFETESGSFILTRLARTASHTSIRYAFQRKPGLKDGDSGNLGT